MTEMEFTIAQLRHAYAQLVAGTVKNQKQFAEGLIAPQIRRLESMETERYKRYVGLNSGAIDAQQD